MALFKRKARKGSTKTAMQIPADYRLQQGFTSLSVALSTTRKHLWRSSNNRLTLAERACIAWALLPALTLTAAWAQPYPAQPWQPALAPATLSNSPSSPWNQTTHPLLVQAQQLIANGEYRNAQALLNTALKNPHAAGFDVQNRITAYQLLAHIANTQHQPERARTQLEKALKLNPNNPWTVTELAWTFAQQSNNSFIQGHPTANARATELFTQAERISQGKPPANYALRQAQWALHQNQLPQAKQWLQQVPQPFPASVPVNLESQTQQTWMQLTLQDPQTQSTQLQKQVYPYLLHQVDLNPTQPGPLMLLAQYFGKQQQPDKALEYALLAQQQTDVPSAERLFFIAKQYQAIGDSVNAMRAYEQVLVLAPSHEPTLIALGELSIGTGNTSGSQAYYQTAIAQNPKILENMLRKAEDTLRNENTQAAHAEFLKLLSLSERYPVITIPALHGLANTVVMDAYYQQAPQPIPSGVRQLYAHYQAQDPLLTNDAIKLDWLLQGGGSIPPDIAARLQQQTNHPNALAAGEALYILRYYPQANKKLDEVDGETAQGYLAAGDRLLALHALTAAGVMYQRGYELEPLPELSAGQRMIQGKRRLAEQRVEEGNKAYQGTRYASALNHYNNARTLYPDWDLPYLRLGDTYTALKQTIPAFQAYRTAVQLNPAYLQGERFAKAYKKLEQKYNKALAAQSKAEQQALPN